jgi:hypothetical protein
MTLPANRLLVLAVSVEKNINNDLQTGPYRLPHPTTAYPTQLPNLGPAFS